MEYPVRFYSIMYPNLALVGSQLTPEQFAKHYTTGSRRSYNGKVIFAEVDSTFRDPYFDIDGVIGEIVPHPDGSPKATKFISSYRVLEHLDFDSLKSLYLTSPEGFCLELESAPYKDVHKPGLIRLFAEIAPMRMLVLSNYDFIQFSGNITDPRNRKGAPKLFYTQIDLDIPEFVEEYEQNPFTQPAVASIHPSALRDGYLQLKDNAGKHTKGLCLDSSLDRIPYKLIRHGFMFASREKNLFYPMPTMAEIEKRNFKFWRTM
ncbi:MAG TPA: hypothetical protein VMV68_05570 [Spirochaetia bacterium]|nr:hypothetical protein [Spirochaetia bacterium]